MPQKLVAPDAAAADVFGTAVDVDGEWLVIGAPLEDSGGDHAGAAYIFKRSGSTWQFDQKLLATDASAGDVFGETVAIFGDTIAIGAPDDSDFGAFRGSVYIFVPGPNGWDQVSELRASDATDGDRFGSAIDLGRWLVIGSPRSDRTATDGGAVYVFSGGGGTWSEFSVLDQPGVALGTGTGHNFGASVATFERWIAVGTPRDSSAATEAGLVSMFRRTGSAWFPDVDLQLPLPVAGDRFGNSLALGRTTLVAGAPLADVSGVDSGGAYTSTLTASGWTPPKLMTPTVLAAGNLYGAAVELDASSILVGAPRAPGVQAGSGRVHHFVRQDDVWIEQAMLLAPGGADEDRFGAALGLSGGAALVGANGDDDAGTFSGSAYIFDLQGLPPGTAYCFGDQQGHACPCGNSSSTSRRGCRHSAGEGMSLDATGSASISADDLVLTAEHCPPGNTGAFVVGTFASSGGAPLFDGLFCFGGDLRILRGQVQQIGTVSDRSFIAQDSTGMYFRVGESYSFQYWTRDVMNGASTCGIGANTSPAYSVRLLP